MAITSLYIKNFRGIKNPSTIPIKPITLFIGPNSSGKSSCLHSLACLSQTLKIPNNSRALSPDDEYAHVHLGRFIEVIHSKSYSDCIGLGISIDPIRYREPSSDRRRLTFKQGLGEARYEFKSTKRTQDIYLHTAYLKVGDYEFEVTKIATGYRVLHKASRRVTKFTLKNGFIFDESSGFSFGSAEEFANFIPFNNLQRAIQKELLNTLYLGPFRQPPARRYATRGSSPIEVGAQGESAVTLLANEIIQSKSRTHIRQIAGWLHSCGLANGLEVRRLARSDMFDVSLRLADGSEFPLADLGYGVSQVLPVFAQCSFAPEGSTLLFEQPELHLHPLAARPLANVFIETAKTKRCRILAETHSEVFFGEFIRQIRAGNFSLDDFVAYRVLRKDGCTHLHPIEIDPETFDIYEMWHSGFSQ